MASKASGDKKDDYEKENFITLKNLRKVWEANLLPRILIKAKKSKMMVYGLGKQGQHPRRQLTSTRSMTVCKSEGR